MVQTKCVRVFRVLLPQGDGQRLLVHPGPVRDPAELRRLPGVHGAADTGEQEGVPAQRGTRRRPQRHREEADSLLRLHAHQEALLPNKTVGERTSER